MNPCQNGGSCLEFGSTFQCICPDSFRGTFCETKNVDLSGVCSLLNPCLNGATCLEQDTNEFRCVCLPGFEGKFCHLGKVHLCIAEGLILIREP